MQFYVETVKQMALRQLIPGSPLRTLCLLIAGQPADAFSADSSPISSMAGAINTSQQPVQVLHIWMLKAMFGFISKAHFNFALGVEVFRLFLL